jgi:hypothetical protein
VPTINDRALTAADSGTTAATLRDFATDKSPKVREAVARNPSTPTDALQVLVRDEKWAVRFAVAENPSSRALPVALGATDPDTRGRAAQREDLDPGSVQLVLHDAAHTVRERLAESTDDASAVAALARDPHPAVRASAVHSDHLSEADVEMLARDSVAQVRAAAAASRRVSPDTLTGMAEDRSVQVRWSVLVNNPERLDLARKIADDADQMNAHQAKAQLDRPRDFTAFLGDVELIT